MRNGQLGSRVIAAAHDPRVMDAPYGSSACVVGNGYVGTVVAACLASLGQKVVGLETDPARLRTLRSGVPFHEPSLERLLSDALRGGTLSFTDDARLAATDSGVVFLCVGSPSRDDGSADLRPLEDASRSVGRWARPGQVFVVKTTVPVGTSRWLASLVAEAGELVSAASVRVVSNPEFLRQGSAIEDFLHPPRIVLGGYDDRAIDAVVDIYRPILDQRFPGGDEGHRPVLIRTTPAVAEAAKYASNAFLATKVSFINEIANICERIGVDVTEVARIMGLDPRIGPEFLKAGLGWGGSCFAKDLDALILTAREAGHQPGLLQSVREVNERQRDVVVAKLCEHLALGGAHITLLGLAFKPGTDDLRGAPSVLLADRLVSRGARVTTYDPVVRSIPELPQVTVAADPYEAVEEADAVVLVTDWPELRRLDFGALRARMRGSLMVDGRNAFDPHAAAEAGFLYEGIGRGAGPEPARASATAEAFARQAS